MGKYVDYIFSLIIKFLTTVTVLILVFVIAFIVKESMPIFNDVNIISFIFGTKWEPISYSGQPSFGIFNIMVSTIYISFIAMIIALYFTIGVSIFLSCVANEKFRNYLYPFIDLLAGIPSVIYGFIGLTIIVNFFEKLGKTSGECILVGGILLSVMILPFMISSCSETMLKIKENYLEASNSLGVSKWYMIIKIVLPLSRRSILISMILAVARAMGETMAVMMVIGNAAVFPSLLGKGETIASLIALEMGAAEVGSSHYHALYAAGLVLMIILFIINTIITVIKNKLIK